MVIDVLTKQGGKFSISDDLRAMLALRGDGELFIAKAYLFNPHVRAFMARLDQQQVSFRVVEADLNVIKQMYQSSGSAEDAHTDMQNASLELYTRAVKKHASDIHIRVSEKQNTRIYFRIHNDLEYIEEHSFDYGSKLCSTIYQAMADVSDATFEINSRQDARISERDKLPVQLDGIRIATTPQVDGHVMVLRLLYNDSANDLDLGKLGFAQQHIDAIEYMKRRPTGVIIIAGPTGSGKSTTLQRVLGSIISETQGRKHIITVEDPPEYPIPGAVQTPVTNADTEEDRSRQYQKAIKSAMRLDPDIIMLSEVRDLPTARLTIQAAMTGHQVWTTVHSNTALGTFDRLSDLGVEKDLLTDPSVVAGLICQRLVKTLCPHCKVKLSSVKDRYSQRDLQRVMSLDNIENVYVRGDGCEKCANTGISGRTVVAETIVTDNKLMSFVRSKNRVETINYVYKTIGNKTMLQHAIEKIVAGQVDPFMAEDEVGLLNAGEIESDHSITVAELAAA